MSRRWQVPGYREVREIGRGAAGTAVLAACDWTGRHVVVRYLPADADRDAARAEARLLAMVHDEHVVRLLAYVEEGDGAAVVTELADGVSLATVLRRHGPIEPESGLCVLKGVLLGVAAVHARGVVHRGCTPANVLVTAAGRTKLAVGGYSADPTDLRSAVALLIRCVTGAAPFDIDSDIARAIEFLPEPLRALAQRAPASNPAGQPATAFLDQLARAARAGYGIDWEERGRRGLGRRAALLAAQFPLAATVGGSSRAAPDLGSGGAPRRPAAESTAAALVAGGLAGRLGRPARW